MKTKKKPFVLDVDIRVLFEDGGPKFSLDCGNIPVPGSLERLEALKMAQSQGFHKSAIMKFKISLSFLPFHQLFGKINRSRSFFLLKELFTS